TTREKAVVLDNPVDIFSSALFHLEQPLPAGDGLDEVIVHLAGRSGKRPTYISDKRQKAKLIGKSEVQLVIRPDAAPLKSPKRPVGTPSVKEFLKETPHEAIHDERLTGTAQRAVGDEKDAWAAARRINSFVHDYIKNKSLSRAFATASEVLETKEGDCTEHAVLFSALAKISGIPTRL